MKNLKDNWIPSKVLNITLKELIINKQWEQHKYSDKNLVKRPINGDKELDVCFGNNLTYLPQLHELTWKALEKYILIDKKGENYFDGWKGFNQIRFNRYRNNQIMSKHCE